MSETNTANAAAQTGTANSAPPIPSNSPSVDTSKLVSSMPASAFESTPANWDIVAHPDGIEATNRFTGAVYTGPHKGFKARLKSVPVVVNAPATPVKA